MGIIGTVMGLIHVLGSLQTQPVSDLRSRSRLPPLYTASRVPILSFAHCVED